MLIYDLELQCVLRAIGGNIRRRRLALRISQGDLANLVNTDRSSICEIEGGSRNITIKMLNRIAGALAIQSHELLNSGEE